MERINKIRLHGHTYKINQTDNVIIGDIPIASEEVLGKVKIGEGLLIDEDGTLTSLNCVIAGTGLEFDGKVLNHINSIDPKTASIQQSKKLTTSDIFNVPEVLYDAEGHITAQVINTFGLPNTATSQEDGFMSKTDKAKLDRVVTTNFDLTSVSQTATNVSINKTRKNVNTDVVENTSLTIPAVSTTLAGVMSAEDKTKLNSIQYGAEVNQNAFSKIAVGDSIILADEKTDTLTVVAGTNILLSADINNDRLTITNGITKLSQLVNDPDYQTKTQVEKYISDLVGGAPEALDTLKELADALANDASFAETTAAQLAMLDAKKVNKEVLQYYSTTEAIERQYIQKQVIEQVTGQSTDHIMSQKAVTDQLDTKVDKSTYSIDMSQMDEKKFDKSSVVQTVGTSTTNVMSLKAVTDQLNTKVDDSTYNAGMNQMDSKKFDKSSVVQSTGDSTTSVMSQKAVTDALATKVDLTKYNTEYSSVTTALGDRYTKSEIDSKLANGSVSKVGTQTVGSASLPIYLNSGTPTACTAASIFSSLTNSGNDISITVAGQTRTLTVPYATGASTATNATNATNATVATKLGTSDVGSASEPIYLAEGVATKCSPVVLLSSIVQAMSNSTTTVPSSALLNGLAQTVSNLSTTVDGKLDKVSAATKNALGLVQIGDNINVNSGVISVPKISASSPSTPGLVAYDELITNITNNSSNVSSSTVEGWGFTKNKGTVTSVKINGSTKNPDTNGLVDLGTIESSSPVDITQDVTGDSTTSVVSQKAIKTALDSLKTAITGLEATKLNASKIQIVSSLPANPVSDTIYFITA